MCATIDNHLRICFQKPKLFVKFSDIDVGISEDIQLPNHTVLHSRTRDDTVGGVLDKRKSLGRGFTSSSARKASGGSSPPPPTNYLFIQPDSIFMTTGRSTKETWIFLGADNARADSLENFFHSFLRKSSRFSRKVPNLKIVAMTI